MKPTYGVVLTKLKTKNVLSGYLTIWILDSGSLTNCCLLNLVVLGCSVGHLLICGCVLDLCLFSLGVSVMTCFTVSGANFTIGGVYATLGGVWARDCHIRPTFCYLLGQAVTIFDLELVLSLAYY